MEEIAPEPPTEPQPQGGKGDKKKLWVAVVAVIVAVALIASAAYVLFIPDEDDDNGDSATLTVTLSPDPVPNVPAGGEQALSVEAMWDEDVVTDGVGYVWSLNPEGIGTLDFTRQPSTTFSAGNAGGETVIQCNVTYQDQTVAVNASLTVSPPFLDTVNVAPVTKTLLIDEEGAFAATVVNSVGDTVTDATLEWSVSGVDVGDYALNSTSGASVTFSASVEATVYLNATATKDTQEASGSAAISVVATSEEAQRTVDTTWYGMFEQPLGPWYETRWDAYGEELLLTDTYPYLYLWAGDPYEETGDIWIYSMMRMNITGRNMTELNMNENAEFIPFFGDARGGNAELNWYMHYITYEEAEEKLSGYSLTWYDGWYIALNGTVTLDNAGAKTVLGITDSQYDDFDTWWNLNSADVSLDWEDWLREEAGNDRVAIFNMYNYDLEFAHFELDAERVGDEIIITLDTVSWAMEALMTRWMHEAWMPTEWYLEDMNFDVRIGAEMADIDIDTSAGYSLYADISEDTGDPCWVWEGLMQDFLESSLDNPFSLFDPYVDLEYYVSGPGNEYNGETLPYTYTPGAWNLSEGETLTFEWPEGDQLFFEHTPGTTGGPVAGVANTTEVMYPMTVVYAEPMPSDALEFIEIDTDARQITYTGPFDMWTWSQDQTAHQNLSDEWDRLGVLPWGIPWVEFRADVSKAQLSAASEEGILPSECSDPATVPSGDAPNTGDADMSNVVLAGSRLWALASLTCAVMLALAALAVGVRRTREQ